MGNISWKTHIDPQSSEFCRVKPWLSAWSFLFFAHRLWALQKCTDRWNRNDLTLIHAGDIPTIYPMISPAKPSSREFVNPLQVHVTFFLITGVPCERRHENTRSFTRSKMFPTQEQHLIQQDAAGDVSTWDDRRDAVFFFYMNMGDQCLELWQCLRILMGEVQFWTSLRSTWTDTKDRIRTRYVLQTWT
jgi:hypothetical protein